MKNNNPLKFMVFLSILVIAGIFLWRPMISLFANAHQLKALVRGFGLVGPIILTLLIVLQVLIAPIPGQAAGFASGFIYGTWIGTGISMLGLLIGSYIAFFLSRRFGRPFVEKIIKKRTLKKFDIQMSDKGVWALFLIFLLPALPDDALCFFAGLTKIDMKTFLLISFLGRLPGFFVLNLVGSGASSSNSVLSLTVFFSLILISVIVFFLRERFEKVMVGLVNIFTR